MSILKWLSDKTDTNQIKARDIIEGKKHPLVQVSTYVLIGLKYHHRDQIIINTVDNDDNAL